MPRKRIQDRIIFNTNDKLNILIESDHKCAHCGKRLSIRKESGFTIEHVIPLNKGGTNDRKNLIALCEDCNQEKSDDIIMPKDYYPYLPQKKLDEITELFKEYIRTTEWFDETTLFQLDRFKIDVQFLVRKGQRRTPVVGHGTAEVQKVKREDAFNWLYAYTAHLAPGDKGLMVTSEKQIDTPYYKIMYQNKDILLFTTYVSHPDEEDLLETPDAHSKIRLDIFINPELKDRGETTDWMLWTIVYQLSKAIQHTLVCTAPISLIDLIITSPQSDKKAKRMYKYAVYQNDFSLGLVSSKTHENQVDGYTLGVFLTLFQGTRTDFIDFSNKYGLTKQEFNDPKSEKAQKMERELRKTMDTRIDETISQEQKPRKPKPHKNHAKANARKKHKHKLKTERNLYG